MPQQQIPDESSTDGPPNACHGRLGRDAVHSPVRNDARAATVSNLHGCAVPACWDMTKLTPLGTSEWPKLGRRQAACGRSRSKRVLRQATEFARTRRADRPAFPPGVASSSSLALHSSGCAAALLHFCPSVFLLGFIFGLAVLSLLSFLRLCTGWYNYHMYVYVCNHARVCVRPYCAGCGHEAYGDGPRVVTPQIIGRFERQGREIK
jgi:hypothetical protein